MATIANSFLRYFLPIGPLCGWAFAFLWRRFAAVPQWRTLGIVLAIFLSVFGVYRAYFADDEGIWPTQQAVAEYTTIRTAAGRWFGPGDVILSDRSDKIFFPSFRAVSPVPPIEAMTN